MTIQFDFSLKTDIANETIPHERIHQRENIMNVGFTESGEGITPAIRKKTLNILSQFSYELQRSLTPLERAAFTRYTITVFIDNEPFPNFPNNTVICLVASNFVLTQELTNAILTSNALDFLVDAKCSFNAQGSTQPVGIAYSMKQRVTQPPASHRAVVAVR
jgi:hypothetical protein